MIYQSVQKINQPSSHNPTLNFIMSSIFSDRAKFRAIRKHVIILRFAQSHSLSVGAVA